MAETLSRDFHNKDIWIDDQSKDTAENATFSAATLKEHDFQRIAIINQTWHLPCAIELFKQQG